MTRDEYPRVLKVFCVSWFGRRAAMYVYVVTSNETSSLKSF